MTPPEISPKSRVILAAIAAGHSYDQILSKDISLTYHDISLAAAEALALVSHAPGVPDYAQSLADIKQSYPRAYDKWTASEDERLTRLFKNGMDVKKIAATLQRQPGAIKSRLAKLNLQPPHPPRT